MGNAKVSYEHYLAKATNNRLELLMKPDEIPDDLNIPVLWRCQITGEIFDRSYHALPKKTGEDGIYGSHGQHYWAKHKNDYYQTASRLGIEFIYDETTDLAPASTRSPVKWRGRNGKVIVQTLHRLKYDKIPNYVLKALGLAEETVERSQILP